MISFLLIIKTSLFLLNPQEENKSGSLFYKNAGPNYMGLIKPLSVLFILFQAVCLMKYYMHSQVRLPTTILSLLNKKTVKTSFSSYARQNSKATFFVVVLSQT